MHSKSEILVIIDPLSAMIDKIEIHPDHREEISMAVAASLREVAERAPQR